jgi:hypothetical protein
MTFKADEVTGRNITPVTLREPGLKPTPFLRLDDGAWWKDD